MAANGVANIAEFCHSMIEMKPERNKPTRKKRYAQRTLHGSWWESSLGRSVKAIRKTTDAEIQKEP